MLGACSMAVEGEIGVGDITSGLQNISWWHVVAGIGRSEGSRDVGGSC